ncbi:MAG: efflux RND transporter periplasmic adaptor subunit [Candidatus Methylumidiphilus sp.]
MSTGHHSYSKLIQALASILGLILLLIWMQGGFTTKTPPGTAQAADKGEPVRGPTAKVISKEIDDIMLWPGTVTARTVAQIAPKVPARILAINVNTGDAVKSDQIVARLDPTELQSRVNQTRSALAAAEAQAAKTGADLRRAQSLFDQEAATRQTLEAAQAAAQTSMAQVAEARAAIATAESTLSETVLRVPFDGTVLKRNQEPGDMAMPGIPVITVQSGQRMRVEAAIPESCARDIQLGEWLKARIAENEFSVKVEEITPAADPKTRTVLVKAGFDNPGAAKPGVFVWLEQNCGSRKVLSVPSSAVSRSGQLESVQLVLEGGGRLRHIRTGKIRDGWVEVLSGLKEGDVVLAGGGK